MNYYLVTCYIDRLLPACSATSVRWSAGYSWYTRRPHPVFGRGQRVKGAARTGVLVSRGLGVWTCWVSLNLHRPHPQGGHLDTLDTVYTWAKATACDIAGAPARTQSGVGQPLAHLKTRASAWRILQGPAHRSD